MNSNSTITNIALFIKRAEEYQTKEFIIDAFASNNIGKVRDVTFIKKQGDYGNNYNGVVVIFEKWNMNGLVQKLFKEMSSSSDGTTRFYFNPNRYWFINIHKQKTADCEVSVAVDSSLPDKERIRQLEELVKSISAQNVYLQNTQEKSEKTIIDLEHKITQSHLINMELRCQLEEKDRERKWYEDKLTKQFEQMRKENNELRSNLAFNEIDITKKNLQIERLKEDIRDNCSILSYIETQAVEIKRMLK